MPAVLIVALAICLILLLRLGVTAEYGEAGLLAYARIAFVRIKLYPRPPEKEKKAKKKKEKKKKEKEEEEKGGQVQKFKAWLEIAGKLLSNVKRRLKIKRLTIHYTAASDDAARAALIYGSANMAVASLLPLIENSFRIEERDIRIDVDFRQKEHSIYAKGIISISVWEILYIAIVFGYNILNKLKIEKKSEKGGT